MIKLEGWVDFIIASLYLIAAMILKISSSDRASTKLRLRLVEANEKTVDVGKGATPGVGETVSGLFDASPLSTFVVDASGAVIYWNPAAERVFGWNRDEMMGQRLPFAPNGPLRNKKAQEIDAAVWSAPLRALNGSVCGTFTIAADAAALRSAGLDSASLTAKTPVLVQTELVQH